MTPTPDPFDFDRYRSQDRALLMAVAEALVWMLKREPLDDHGRRAFNDLNVAIGGAQFAQKQVIRP